MRTTDGKLLPKASAPVDADLVGRSSADHARAGVLSAALALATDSETEAALLSGACQLLCSQGRYTFAAVALRDAADNELQLAAQWGAATMADTPLALPQDASADRGELLARVLRDDGPQQWLADGDAAAPWPLGSAETAAVVAAWPLRVEGAAVGVLMLGAGKAEALAADAGVLSDLAATLGLALGRLRADAAHAVSDRAQAFRVLQATLSTPHVGVLVLSAQHTVRFVNSAFCTLFHLDAAPDTLHGLSLQALRDRLPVECTPSAPEWQRIGEMLAACRAAIGDEVRMRDGRVFLRDFTPICIDQVDRGSLWQWRDITAQKLHEKRIEQLAYFDEVSGLPNRRRLFELLEDAHLAAAAQQDVLAVGVLDLDRFKNVNDTVGRDGGDRVLTETAARILGMLRPDDMLARFGGDEFALVISGLDSKEQLDAISRCILQALRAPYVVAGEQIQLSASVGWTLFPRDDADAEGLVRHAELALFTAKEEGRDCGLLYEPTMEAEQLRLRAMRERIARALKTSRLQLLFQPIVYIDGLPGRNGVAGMEALLRLDDTGKDLVEPARFMHVLDDPQLARPIGRYVLEAALQQCHAWMLAGVSIPVSVNISTRHLLHPAFFGDIESVLDSYPDVMEIGFGIEITETGPSMDYAPARAVIEECRSRGIRVGLDDFGTGSASLSHIQQLDIEHIKLDQSFVRDILVDDRNMAIAAGVITTARMLAKTVIAEGVETPAQGDLLASLGCHQLQGYSISRPMPSAAVPGWVTRWTPPASWAHLVDERHALLAESGDAGEGALAPG
jgi:diguanylate cyclase (GGDEF)-like protein